MFRLIFLSIIFSIIQICPLLWFISSPFNNNSNSILIIYMDVELTTPVHLTFTFILLSRIIFDFFFFSLSLSITLSSIISYRGNCHLIPYYIAKLSNFPIYRTHPVFTVELWTILILFFNFSLSLSPLDYHILSPRKLFSFHRGNRASICTLFKRNSQTLHIF